MSGVALVAAPAAIGIRQYSCELAAALAEAGIDTRVVDRMSDTRGSHAHAQLGNSTRGQLPALATEAPTLVTLHDVVPRDPRVRAALARPQARVLSRHRVVVHSRHARKMLEGLGFTGSVRVLPPGAVVRSLAEERREALRRELAPGGEPVLVVAGVLKRARGSLAVLEAASSFPDAVFVFVGDVGDGATAAALGSSPANVVHLPGRFGEAFYEPIAAADVLLNFRLDSVGETSGPMLAAHAWGTPMAAWAVGAIPEYRAAADLLFDTEVPVAGAIAEVLTALPRLGRVPQDDPAVTSWDVSARLYAEEYASLGWV